jgi:hypothetical protein
VEPGVPCSPGRGGRVGGGDGLVAGTACVHGACGGRGRHRDPRRQPTATAGAHRRGVDLHDQFHLLGVVGDSCGESPTITIPLNLTSSNPATPDMSSWSYSASSSLAGLIADAEVVADNYVITLNESAVHPGDSDTINVSVTPPNNVTPDGTAWARARSSTTPT